MSRHRLRTALPVLAAAVLAAIGLVLAAPQPPGAQPALRVMPLGDSITEGTGGGDGYRAVLRDLLRAGGKRLEFVGGRPGTGAGLEHEGHGGYRIDQLQEIIDDTLTRQVPDVVLLHIGSNDIGQGYRVDTAPQRLLDLAERVCTLRPSAEVFVASIIDVVGLEAAVATYNAHIPGIVATLQARACRAHYVDLNPTVRAGDLVDGVHPNARGYAALAAGWYPPLALAAAGASRTVLPTVNDDALYYTGYWQHETDRPDAYWSDQHVSANTGDVALLGYQGTVLLYGTRCPSCGIAAISIDDRPPVAVDLYAPSEQGQVEIFRSDPAGPGLHRLTVRVTGFRASAATGAVVVLDRVDLLP